MFCIVVRCETYWDITNLQGQVQASGGDAESCDADYYAGTSYVNSPDYNNGGYGNFQTYSEVVCLPEGSCSTFNLFDYYGDG